MNIKHQISNIKIVVLAFLFITLWAAQPAFASSHCRIAGGQSVPNDKQATNPPGTNHVYTGSECSAIRAVPGSSSIVGPGQFGDPNHYRCLGACTYEVNYCTYDECAATYSVRDCPSTPAQCNNPNTAPLSNIGQIFGKIIPPQEIINFGFGAAGISTFLSNLVVLIFSLAAVVLVFMILWGAFDWITSEGDKEKVARARDKIINAIIGILLFAAAFAIIRVLGQFSGFTFFVGQ